MTDSGSRRPATKIIVFGSALLLALASALAVGLVSYHKLSAGTPEQSAGPGQVATFAGFSYRLAGFTVASSFPAEDKGDPVVRSPSGSSIVLVVFDQTPVAATADLADHYCKFTLRTAQATWEPDTDFTDLIRRPDAQGCGGTEDDPLRLGRTRQIGVSFVVPAAVAAQTSFRLALGKGEQLIDLHR